MFNREYALPRLPYVQVNSADMINYIIFDLDYAEGEFADVALGIPAFTFAIVNPRNGHAHVMYEIDAYPVHQASLKSRELMKAVVAGYRRLLAADRVITHKALAKNPLHGRWRTYGSGDTHTLTELVESIPAIKAPKRVWNVPSQGVPKFGEILHPSSRNCSLFEFVRFVAYSLVASCKEKQELYYGVIGLLEKANKSEVTKYFSSLLSPSELACIARSVTGWTWDRRNQFKQCRRGAMNLPSLKGNYLPYEKWQKEVKMRQQAAGRYAAATRRQMTRDLIASSLSKFQSGGVEPGLRMIAADTGLSYSTIQRHKDILKTHRPQRSAASARTIGRPKKRNMQTDSQK